MHPRVAFFDPKRVGIRDVMQQEVGVRTHVDAGRPGATDNWIEMTGATGVAIEPWTQAILETKVAIEEDATLFKQRAFRRRKPRERRSVLALERNLGLRR